MSWSKRRGEKAKLTHPHHYTGVHVDQMPTEVGLLELCDPFSSANLLSAQNTVYDEPTNSLSIYWKKGVDVLRWLADTNNDAHLQRVRHHAEHHARMMESTSGDANAESALFDDDDDDEDDTKTKSEVKMTAQHVKSRDVSSSLTSLDERRNLTFLSMQTTPPKFEELEEKDGHSIQHVRELQTVPVIVTVSS